MRAHEHLHRTVGESLQRAFLLGGAAEAREHLDLHVEGVETVFERDVVLLRQNGGRAQHHDLLGVLRRLERRTQRHLGLAESDVAADQAIHRPGRLHVGLDLGDRRQLVGRFVVGEGFFHLALPRRIGRIAEALHARAARVDIHQVEGELLGGLAGLRQRTRPVARVQARAARAGPLGTDVARHAVELLDRNEQLVAFGVFEQEIIAHHAADVLAHDVFEQRHAVGRMHHVVARRERKGDLGHIDAAAASDLRGAPLRVVHRHKADLGLGNDHAQGYVHVDHVHHAALELAHVAMPRLVVGARTGRAATTHATSGLVGFLRLAVARFHPLVQDIDHGQRVINQQKLHVAAGAHVRHAEHHGIALVDQRAQAADQLFRTARHLGALDRQLVVHHATDLHDRRKRIALRRTEIERGGRDVEPVGHDMASLRALAGVFVGARRVVEDAARLAQNHERFFGGVGA